MNVQVTIYANTSAELELILEFARKVEALRLSMYPNAKANPDICYALNTQTTNTTN